MVHILQRHSKFLQHSDGNHELFLSRYGIGFNDGIANSKAFRARESNPGNGLLVYYSLQWTWV